ncbi:MAG: type II toxin-antitoxin system RelE/ParE family toxin [Gammaproteobacteria bacterium]|nr:type II toxin-antitoxin system RelE/ParE family toxin [Gammaproteobacteria bacterium]
MHIEQTPTFRRAYKKLHPNQRQAVNEAVRAIVDDPLSGEEKRGDLSKVFVYKFECVDQQYLLAYRWDEDWRLLLALGPHENFYRDMKR